MSPNELGTALRDLVDGVEDDALAPAPADLWRDGSRRRVRTRAVAGLAAASVAAMVALLAWPAGEPRASVPADGTEVVDGRTRLTSYPENIALPLLAPTSDSPGRAAVVLRDADDPDRWHSVSPTGDVHRIVVSDAAGQAAALSPDGRWLAAGASLIDLVEGTSPQDPSRHASIRDEWWVAGAWWSPDSEHVYLRLTDPAGVDRDAAVVLGTDGSAEEVPQDEGGIVPTIAGWTGDDSVISLGSAENMTDFVTTRWTRGSASWTPTTMAFTWSGVGAGREVLAETTGWVDPGGDLLLLTTTLQNVVLEAPLRGRATIVDLRTGRVLGFPDDDGTWPGGNRSAAFIEWEGQSCGPVWRSGGVPAVLGDGGGDLARDGAQVVQVSGRFGDPCPLFAGEGIRGASVSNTLAVWQERAWVYGVPAALILLAVGALLAWRRRRPGRPGPLPQLWSFRT